MDAVLIVLVGLIYVIGCLFAFQRIDVSNFILYTNNDKLYRICLTLLSWLGLIIVIMIDKDYDKSWPTINKTMTREIDETVTVISENDNGDECIFVFRQPVSSTTIKSPIISMSYKHSNNVTEITEDHFLFEELNKFNNDVDKIVDNLCSELKINLNKTEDEYKMKRTDEVVSEIFKSIIISEINVDIEIRSEFLSKILLNNPFKNNDTKIYTYNVR